MKNMKYTKMSNVEFCIKTFTNYFEITDDMSKILKNLVCKIYPFLFSLV